MRKIGIVGTLILSLVISGCVHRNLEVSIEEAGPSANDYPIVLVYGFLGFPPDEGDTFFYWGGDIDLPSVLRSAGYPVMEGGCGPFSSNWDRACELYAWIKGGQVDYGKAHSERFGHNRFGRSYPGIYPEWGTIDPDTGKIRKIHLITHSMGGLTARLLAWMLENGDEEERAAGESSPFFEGGRHWVHSMMTLSAPHDGTHLTQMFTPNWSFFTSFLREIAVMTQNSFDQGHFYWWERWKALGEPGGSFYEFLSENQAISDNPAVNYDIGYDVMLDQWGIIRLEGESSAHFRKRVEDQIPWPESADTSIYDLTREGAAEFNARYTACSDIYYFSWANTTTRKAGNGSLMLPHPDTAIHFLASIPFLVSYGDDPSWYSNDGVVNTVSMAGPRKASPDEIIDYDGLSRRGMWNYLGLIEATDHVDIIGMSADGRVDGIPAAEWYARQCDLLRSLPPAED